MFTGIITAIGQIEELKDAGDRWLKANGGNNPGKHI